MHNNPSRGQEGLLKLKQPHLPFLVFRFCLGILLIKKMTTGGSLFDLRNLLPLAATTLYLAPALLCSPLLLNNRWGTTMMRLPCRHFKCECGFFLCPGEGECVSGSTPASTAMSVCVQYVWILPLHLQPLSSVTPPPLWTSSSPLQLLSFSSQLAPFSLVTARALNFHDCCLFLAHSSSLLLSSHVSLLPSSFPTPCIPSLAALLLLPPSLLFFQLSILP